MEKWKSLKLSEKIRYIIGIIYVISGFGSIFTGQMTFIAGLFTGLFGLSLLPVVYTKFNISTEKKLHIIIPIILFLISCMCMPTEETTVPTNNETNNTVNEAVTNITENTTTEDNSSEENTENQQSEKTENTEEEQKQENTTSSEPKQEEPKKETTTTTPSAPTTNSQTVYRTPTGKKYHLDPDCGGKNSKATTLDSALSSGLTPCQKCAQ